MVAGACMGLATWAVEHEHTGRRHAAACMWRLAHGACMQRCPTDIPDLRISPTSYTWPGRRRSAAMRAARLAGRASSAAAGLMAPARSSPAPSSSPSLLTTMGSSCGCAREGEGRSGMQLCDAPHAVQALCGSGVQAGAQCAHLLAKGSCCRAACPRRRPCTAPLKGRRDWQPRLRKRRSAARAAVLWPLLRFWRPCL